MEREIKLLEYLPEILQPIREYQLLSEVESPEITRLYQEIERLLQNSFIETADVQGIKRWEQLLGIQAESQNLEERRTAILGRWNRSLPYTMTRLREYLDVLASSEGYQLSLRPQNYYLELLAEDQPLAVLRAMRSLVQAMIPANLIFCLADRIPSALFPNIKSSSGFLARSTFYPRYNLELLCLDDNWDLSGAYSLDGYKAGQTIEFYPARMQVGGAVNTPLTLAAIPTARSHSRQVITNRHRETIRSPTAATMSHKFQLQVTGAAAQQTNLRKIDHYKSWYGCQETTKSAATSKTTVKGQPTMARQIVIQSELPQKTSGNFKLKVEKDLWYLNEETLLDGSRRLDADIFHYEL